MTPPIGIKADPILYRYSYPWLFSLMDRLNVRNLQFGSFFEMYSLPDRYFLKIRAQAEDYGIRIRSCFTSHRELGGFFFDDPDMQDVAMTAYRRYIEIGVLLGADSVGSNPGSVLRDHMDGKDAGSSIYLEAMTRLATYAAEAGLTALTVEPMSCTAEPPTSPQEITHYMTTLAAERARNPAAMVPVYLCGDTSHGHADIHRNVINTNMDLFVHGIPWMWEFHFKNTDGCFNSTFGFAQEEMERGIVDLSELRRIVDTHRHEFPTEEPVGYLELPGPKLGRDYTDHFLGRDLEDSIKAIRELYVENRVPARS